MKVSRRVEAGMKSMMFYRFEMVSVIRKYPALFYPLLKINNRIHDLYWPAYIRQGTEFVIEGYFRSGNTFAARAFSISQQYPVQLASHTHAIATLVLAVQRNIPTLVLLRNPADTVISATLKAPGTTLQQHLRWYICYYEKVFQLRNLLYIALFDEVTQDFGCVIKNVNKRFGTQFTPFIHSTENEKDVFSWIENMDHSLYREDISRYSLPLRGKEKYKEDLKKQLERENAQLLKKADDLYRRIVENRFLG